MSNSCLGFALGTSFIKQKIVTDENGVEMVYVVDQNGNETCLGTKADYDKYYSAIMEFVEMSTDFWEKKFPNVTEKKNKIRKKGEGKMAKEKWGLTDEEVEAEIARLNASEAVALARREIRLKYRRRQRLYQLRDLEKKGKALMEAGITREVLDAMYTDDEEVIDINFEK